MGPETENTKAAGQERLTGQAVGRRSASEVGRGFNPVMPVGVHPPTCDDRLQQNNASRPPTDEELLLQFEALPIEERIHYLRSAFDAMHQRLNGIVDYITDVARRQDELRRSFHHHVHPNIGQGPFTPAE